MRDCLQAHLGAAAAAAGPAHPSAASSAASDAFNYSTATIVGADLRSSREGVNPAKLDVLLDKDKTQ